MIPKVIHYCWFGGNPLPESAKLCIESWKKYLPGYEIKEWNESNFDVNSIPYTRDAYQARKFAFVSDYARFYILHRYGGVYFDTDVEAVAPMDDLLEKGSFMAWETAGGEGKYMINPGLGLAAMPGEKLYKEMLEGFHKLHFFNPDGTQNQYSMIPMVTDMLIQKGMKDDGSLQIIDGMTVYPDDYFCPMNPLTGITTRTENTRTIHHYTMSWMSQKQQNRLKVTRILRRIFGTKTLARMKFLFRN